jgi:hypothetical protein
MLMESHDASSLRVNYLRQLKIEKKEDPLFIQMRPTSTVVTQ